MPRVTRVLCPSPGSCAAMASPLPSFDTGSDQGSHTDKNSYISFGSVSSTVSGAVPESTMSVEEHPVALSADSSEKEQIPGLQMDAIVGHFSFAPATKTTVVTTTTTTTTNFPPLVMKAPRHLHSLDPKMYPLASSPTPQSIKRFCVDIGGRSTVFREAENSADTLQKVR